VARLAARPSILPSSQICGSVEPLDPKRQEVKDFF
jgi:hypothetical protein